MNLATPERRELLALARASIDSALSSGSAVRQLVPFTTAALLPGLTVRRSSFVTLRRGEELRGCCGTLDAPRPLAEDVWRNAWAAAFNDYRFPPLTAAEWPHMNVHLSLLTVPEPLDVATEEQLLAHAAAVDRWADPRIGCGARDVSAGGVGTDSGSGAVRAAAEDEGRLAGGRTGRRACACSRYTTESFGEESSG